jgi:formylglycine-generating enzyme required for sulfatase activity
MEEGKSEVGGHGTVSPGVPHRVGNYEIVCKVGEGGMGTVYKAWHVELETFVAIKFLTPALAENEVFVKRFKREARLAAQLTSPYSVRTTDVGETGGLHYIVMEYVNGQTINDILERRGKLSDKESVDIIYGVARALQEAHGKGIIHRDIKPENVMLAQDDTPKLADLGIAKQITSTEQNLTATSFAIGTPSYMSPEQAQGRLDIDARSDIYSLGATFYRMVVGGLPFTGETPLSVMHKIATEPVHDPLQINPAISKDLGAVICKMMATQREDRYQTMSELIRHLEALRAGRSPGLDYESTSALLRSLSPTVHRPPAPKAGRLTPKRRKVLIGVVAAVVALLVIGVLLLALLFKGRERVPSPEISAMKPVTAGAKSATPAPEVETATASTSESARRVTEAVNSTAPAKETATPPATEVVSVPTATTSDPAFACAAALAEARDGNWDTAQAQADKSLALAKDNALYRRLKDVVDAGKRAAGARSVVMRLLADGGKPPAGYRSVEDGYARLREQLGRLDVKNLGAVQLDPFVRHLDESADGFRKAAVSVIEATFPDLQGLSQGGDAMKGFMALHDARQKYPDLAVVKQLADQYDPLGEGVTIAVDAAGSKDTKSAEEAAKAVEQLGDALARCDKIAGDAAYKANAASLRNQVLQYRAAAFEVVGDPCGMLADAYLLLQGGNPSAEAVADRAVRQFMSKFKAGLDADPAGAARLIEDAASRFASDELAPARKALNDAMAVSDLRSRIFRDRSLLNAWVRNIGSFVPSDMVRIPAGTFPLGENHDGLVAVTPSSAPQHDVRIEEFCMDVNEVTNLQFQKFVDAGGYTNDAWWTLARGIDRSAFVDSTGRPGPKDWKNGQFPEGKAGLPVAGVSWYEASAYAAWASKALPDEVQWECAAAGLAPTEAGGAFKKSASAWTAWYARIRANPQNPAPAAPLPAGSNPDEKTPLGGFDMVGSLREWTASLYDKYPGSQCPDRDLGTGLVVVRGLCFNDTVLQQPSPARRRGWPKETRNECIGFRCVWIGPEKPSH